MSTVIGQLAWASSITRLANVAAWQPPSPAQRSEVDSSDLLAFPPFENDRIASCVPGPNCGTPFVN